jgi:hypothetical protein
MGFFDGLRFPGSEVSEVSDEEDYTAPEWLEAPTDFVAGVVPLEHVLARSDEAAVFITRIAAYPVGFEFDVELFARKAVPHDAFELIDRTPPRPDESLPAVVVRVGIEFADGRRAASLGGMFDGTVSTIYAVDEDETSPDPGTEIRMNSGGGGGSYRNAYRSYWVWPLPPDGPLRFVCEWPAFGISETSIEIDSSLIREASKRAVSVWSA